jgi:hypothetical protein
LDQFVLLRPGLAINLRHVTHVRHLPKLLAFEVVLICGTCHRVDDYRLPRELPAPINLFVPDAEPEPEPIPPPRPRFRIPRLFRRARPSDPSPDA